MHEPRLPLSPRERETLLWAARGKTCAETGIILGLSACTVRIHRDHAKWKLQATNGAHAVAKAMAAGVLTTTEIR